MNSNLPFFDTADPRIVEVIDYTENGSLGVLIKFANGLSLSIIEDNCVSDLMFELAIFDKAEQYAPQYFDNNDNVIDCLRGCSPVDVNYYISKLSNHHE